MSTEYADTTHAQVRETITRLQSPIPDLGTLLPLLAAPLACIQLLPPRFRNYNTTPITAETFSISRHIPALQRALLEHVLPAWEPVLKLEDTYELIEQYFYPDAISFASPAAGQLALYAYDALLSISMRDYSIRLLAKLCKSYPVDVLHSVLFSDSISTPGGRRSISWEDCVRDVISIPAKVANYMAGRSDIPSVLEHGTYFADVSIRTENLIHTSSAKKLQGRFHLQ